MKKSIPCPTHIILLQSLVLLSGTVTSIAHAQDPTPADNQANDVFSPPFDEPQIPSEPPPPSLAPSAEQAAPQALPSYLPADRPNAWQRARSKIPPALLWGWVPTALLGGYFSLVAAGQKDAAVWAGAHGTTLVLDQVWISKDAASIQGRFVW